MSSVESLPLAVDLDGTLSRTNSIAEQVAVLIRTRPWLLVTLVWALLVRGRPGFKRQLQSVSPIEHVVLPVQEAFVSFLREQATSGRELILVTAADQSTATHIASMFPLFTEGVGSSGSTNLSGRSKASYLVQRYGERGFVYAGNERRDLRVWQRAGGAIVVNPSIGLLKAATKLVIVEKVFDDRPPRWRSLIRCVRPHQWLKNILVFVPVLTAHRLGDASIIVSSALAFVAFCAAASGAYVLNDLTDLPSDRAHATKRKRPFASGDVPLEWVLVLLPLLFSTSAALVAFLPIAARWVLVSYIVLTFGYSMFVKRVFLLDAVVLAGLFAVRIGMGHAATGIAYSAWLTSFAVCMFLSLALLKRFSELTGRGEGHVPGRGYHSDHRQMIGVIGVSVGILSSIVIALYAGSAHVRTLYTHSVYIYALSPLFLAWVLRMWRLGYQGKMHEDPVLFTLHDLFSIAVGALTFLVVLLAR